MHWSWTGGVPQRGQTNHTSKTKFSSIRQYNPKKPKKWGFKNLVRAGSSGMMYDFFIYEGKPSTNDNDNTDNTDYDHLQKSAQVVANWSTNSFKQSDTVYFTWKSTKTTNYRTSDETEKADCSITHTWCSIWSGWPLERNARK